MSDSVGGGNVLELLRVVVVVGRIFQDEDEEEEGAKEVGNGWLES